MEFLYESLVTFVLTIITPVIVAKLSNKSTIQDLQVSWLGWLAACTVGGGIGGALSAIFTLSAGGLVFGGYGNWALFGASIGVMQWIVLRRYIAVSNYWALLTVVGWLLFAFFQATRFPPNLVPPYLDWVQWILVGLFVGVLQWTNLRKKIEKPAMWVLANGIAWVIAGTVGVQAGLIMLSNGVQLFAAWVIGWAIVGLIGGLILRVFFVAMRPIKIMGSE